LKAALAGGQVLAKEIEKESKEAGVSRSTYKRARAHLRVKATKSAMMGGWVLSLPASNEATQTDKEIQDSQPESLESLESLREEPEFEESQYTEETQGTQESHPRELEPLRALLKTEVEV
jgi:hypothetical protein